MIVFDLSDRETFDNLDSWLTEVEKHCGPDVSVVIMANKSDLGKPKRSTKNSTKDYQEFNDNEEDSDEQDR